VRLQDANTILGMLRMPPFNSDRGRGTTSSSFGAPGLAIGFGGRMR
jgi:hypothetical protein